MEETQVGGSSSGYDVFINFRGEDTRNTFVGHLYRALKGRGIRAFIDSKDLRKGEDIDYLLNVIRGCELSIAVFSQRYAESRWCLKELSQMLEAHTIILPIFFKVEPSDVKNQTGCFEISPLTHTNEAPETLLRWKNALRAAGDKSGRVFHDGENESELVDQVVEDAWSRLNKASLIDVKNSVGLESRVQHVLSLLFDDKSEDVQFLGICGQGGIGKTTIATTVYNRISKSFSKSCFLENVREQASQPNGLVSLQEKLLEKITGVETKVCSSKEGSQLIKEIFQNMKTLLVLDDLDNRTQLNALACAPNWFGPESRIIITTRDKSVLSAVPEKNRKIHEHEELNKEESLKLFSLHAFSTDEPPDNFMKLSLDIVCTTGGLPLALEVLGSDLSMTRDEEDKPLWNSMLRMLQHIPHDAVFEKLKISFDSLNEIEKAMFLDVACLFIGWEEETVISIWEACGFEPRCRMEVLKRKSLLKIQINEMIIKELWMHDQIRDMGRRITYNQEPNNPHKHSRLWSFDDTMKVLRSDKGNEMVEGLSLRNRTLGLRTKDFQMMPKLRLLEIDKATMEGRFQRLPSALKWFQWLECPLKKLSANNFHEDLVMLDLSRGSFRQAWKIWRENKRFQQLKVLRLSYCWRLSQSPDLSGFPHLERLYLDHCRSLVTLHESIGELQHLVYLNLEGCRSLKELPNSMCRMRSLQTLNLEDVDISVLYTLLESRGIMKNSKKLEILSQGDFYVKVEQFRCFVNTGNFELRELISRMGRHRNVVTNQRSWQRQDQQGTSLGISIEKLKQIWIPLQKTVEGSLKRYLIPDDIDEIGACRLVMHVSLDLSLAENIAWIELGTHVHMKAGNKIACEVTLAIWGLKKSICRGQVDYIHEFKGFDWFGVQLEGNDVIEILDATASVKCLPKKKTASANLMLWPEVLGVRLYLVKEGRMFDRHQFSTESQSYGERCVEMVRYPPTEDEDEYQNPQQSNLLRRKKQRRAGLMRCGLQD